MSDITRDDLALMTIADGPPFGVLFRMVGDEDVPAILRALLTDECEPCGGTGIERPPNPLPPELQGASLALNYCPVCGGRGWLPKAGVVLDWRCFVAELNPEHPIKDANADGTPEHCRYFNGHSSRCGWYWLIPTFGTEADNE